MHFLAHKLMSDSPHHPAWTQALSQSHNFVPLHLNNVNESIKPTHPFGKTRHSDSDMLQKQRENTLSKCGITRLPKRLSTVDAIKQCHWVCQRLLTHFDAKLWLSWVYKTACPTDVVPNAVAEVSARPRSVGRVPLRVLQ